MKLSIVIPTYNEKENIEVLIPQLEKTLRKNNIPSEVIIVDDNSPDGTADSVKKLNKKYKNINLILRKDRKGIASAWFEGFNYAKGKYIACMDADLCHSPGDLIKMYNSINDFDIIIGSRYMIKGSAMKGKTLLARFVSHIAQSITRFMTGMKGNDLTHSFRIFKREVFHSIKNQLKCEGNIFLVEFLYKACKRGFRHIEVPITYGQRKYGATKLKVRQEALRFIYKIILLRLGV